jgi:hypothetical protein
MSNDVIKLAKKIIPVSLHPLTKRLRVLAGRPLTQRFRVCDYKRWSPFRTNCSKAAIKFVFIIAYGRSGSTLLQKIIGSVDGFHIIGENNNILHGLLTSYHSAVEAKQTEGRHTRDKSGDPWRGIDLLNPRRYGQRLAEVFVEEVLQPPLGTKAIGFKETSYIDQLDTLARDLDYMRELFAPAFLIFNKRDLVATTNSRRRKWVSPGTPIDELDEFQQKLKTFDERVRVYAAAHPTDTIVINYDQYTRNPDSLEALFAFLGEPFDKAKIEQILSVRLDHTWS